MVNFTIFAGGYDVFIAAYLFNSDAKTLSLSAKYPSGGNPSWISLHPTDRSILYATNELNEGALQSFEVRGSTLSAAVDTTSSGGANPAFAVALSTGEVAIMNYSGGNGRIVPTSATDPKHFIANAPVIPFTPPAGGDSHPHMALQHGAEVLVPDLGADTIWRLAPNGAPGVWTVQGSIPQPKGSGPRHIAIANNRLFTLHELSSTLTTQAINGPAAILSSVSIIPANPPPGAVYAAAEILAPPPSLRFPTQYIYVSNRNTGTPAPAGDSIAIFENVGQGTRQERLRLVAQVFTGLQQIRGMEFSGEDAEFLVAAGVVGSAGVVVYRRVNGGQGLEEVVRNTEIATRTSFVWV